MKQSAALVLSSGVSRGLAQIGVINELEMQGFEITSVAGSSIGSVIGGLYAMGQLDAYTDWVSDFNKKDVWSFMDFTLTTHGLLKGKRIFETMKSFIPDMNIEEMPIPFAAVATDIINEKPVVFTKGSFYDAVRASVAIPAIFTPVKFDDTLLVDGGLLNPVPIKYVSRKKSDMLIVVNLYGKNSQFIKKTKEVELKYLNRLFKSLTDLISTGDKHSMGYYSLLNKSSLAMIKRIAEMTIDKYKPDLVIDIPHDSANTFDFYRAKELIHLGKSTAKEAINNYYENL